MHQLLVCEQNIALIKDWLMALCHILCKRTERRALSADHSQTIPWATVSSLALSLSLGSQSSPHSPHANYTDLFMLSRMGKTVVVLNIFFLHLLLYILPKEERWHLIQPILLRKLQNQVRTETSISFSYVPRLCTYSASKPANPSIAVSTTSAVCISYEPLYMSSC